MSGPDVLDKGVEALRHIRTWKRAAITLTLGLGVVFGALVYQHPHWIERTAAHFVRRELTLADAERIRTELPGLRTALAARLVLVMQSRLAENTEWLAAFEVDPAYAAVAATLPDLSLGTVRPIFAGDANELMGRLVTGEAFCVVLDEAQQQAATPVVRALSLLTLCFGGIPPGPSALVGWILAGFERPLTPVELRRTRAVLLTYGEAWAE